MQQNNNYFVKMQQNNNYFVACVIITHFNHLLKGTIILQKILFY